MKANPLDFTRPEKVVFIGAIVLLILIALVSNGCTETEEKDDGLIKYENGEVSCYRIFGYDGIWCYRKETNPSCPAPPKKDEKIIFIR